MHIKHHLGLKKNSIEEGWRAQVTRSCGAGHDGSPFHVLRLLKVCTTTKDIQKGSKLHEYVREHNYFGQNTYIGNILLSMYAKCGAIAKAHQVLKELPMRNVVSWNALIAGYNQQGQGEEALKCFDDMLCEGHCPNAITCTCVLKACGSIGAAAKGEEIHDKILILGMLEKDLVLGNTLVDMYVKCGQLAKAHQVLKELPVRDVVSWSALIGGYTQHGQGEEALNCLDGMLHEGHFPNAITYICVLKACGNIRAVAKGEEIHEKIVSLGMLQKDVALGNTLVDMYAKCGELVKARRVLKEFSIRNVVSWSALIAGYTQQGQGEEALKCFNDMLHDGCYPDAITFVFVLKACGSIREVTKGEEIHGNIVSLGMLEKDVVLGTALVDMYAKCNKLAKAHGVLKELPMCDVVSWSALIAGYTQHGQGQEALKCFDDMLHDGHSPNAITYICVLKACGSIGAAAKGKEIHDMIISLGMLERDVVLGTTLLDMYAKCGEPAKAHQVLEELSIHDAGCWSALIAGYAQQGQSVEAINCFEQMQANGARPNLISLTILLNTCSHAGLLDHAQIYFLGLIEKYGFHPSSEHYCCMIDLFGRAGKLNKALSVIAEVPNDKCLPSWVALLGACLKWAEVKTGALAFEHALHLDKHNAAIYVVMADIYTVAGMQEDVHAIEMLRVANEAW